MKDSKDLLGSVLKTTQMGQVGIQALLKKTLGMNMQAALRSQLREYDRIEREAKAVATVRGWELQSLDPSAKAMADFSVRMQLAMGSSDSKAAAMMIRGNTRGMIKGIKNLHSAPPSDERVSILSQRLIDCEKANIVQMQEFL